MSVTTIILSKDRPAQLDLLLQSIERNGGGHFSPIVICKAPGNDLGQLSHIGNGIPFWFQTEDTFEWHVRFTLEQAGEFVCFMCDDGILYRPRERDAMVPISPDVLCFSLRLGTNTTRFYPADAENVNPMGSPWNWTERPWQEAGDFYYPGSIDAHVFRTEDVRRMLDGKTFPNPTALECALVEGCREIAAERPLMACYPHSVYVGNPINRVSDQSGVRFGQTYPVTAAECQEKFASGLRIDLDALDFTAVNGAHTEIELKWR